MKVLQHQHIGTRGNQEDAFGYTENAYVVCDGVGGYAKGEVASKMVVAQSLERAKQLTLFSKITIQALLENIQTNLNAELESSPSLEKMGTTFCGVFIDKHAIYFAHIGDSRIYWVKPNKREIWHTWDHSLVGYLVKHNEITREEGRKHPKGNQIQRAIVANKANKIAKADISKGNHLEADDVILICTDGVNECWEEFELMNLLCDTTITLENKKSIIAKKCQLDAADNNTFLILQIEKDDVINSGANEELTWLKIEAFKSIPEQELTQLNNEEQNTGVKTVQDYDLSLETTEEDKLDKEQLDSNLSGNLFLNNILYKFLLFILVFIVGWKSYQYFFKGDNNMESSIDKQELKDTKSYKLKPKIIKIDNSIKQPIDSVNEKSPTLNVSLRPSTYFV
jgi:PPM family protein phosphatase